MHNFSTHYLLIIGMNEMEIISNFQNLNFKTIISYNDSLPKAVCYRTYLDMIDWLIDWIEFQYTNTFFWIVFNG